MDIVMTGETNMTDKPTGLPPLCKHLVYWKDKAGNTIRAGETVYQNRILQHPPEFAHLSTVLEQIKDLKVRNEDVWLLDFSKSGTHWMLSILKMLANDESGFLIDAKVQGMLEVLPDLRLLDNQPSPRILNTHMRLNFIKDKLLEQNKIIAMIRNPKSVAVSLYHHTKNLPFYDYAGTFHDYLPEFMKGYFVEFYGSWFDYVLEYWSAFKGKPNVMFVFYEEMKRDPVKVIGSVSEFLGYSHEPSFIEKVATDTSIGNLKDREAKKATEPLQGQILNIMMRKGTTTDWKTHFTVAENELFDALYEEKMKDYPDLKERISFS